MNIQIRNNKNLKEFLKTKQNCNFLIISGRKSFFKSGANILFKNLNLSNFKIYLKNSIYPTLSEINKIIKVIKYFKPNYIISVGGGSVIDLAKISNLFAKQKKAIPSFLKKKLIFKNYCKSIVVPLTAGSGSEATSFAVVYYKKKKFSVESKQLLTKNYFLEPQLIKNAPYYVKGSSALDSMCQSIESIISINSNKISIKYAKKSLNIFLKNFKNYLLKPNLINSHKMQIASNLSGKSINISKTTGPHAVSYFLTSFYGVSHGFAVAMFLNNFLIFNYKNFHLSKNSPQLKLKFKILFNIFHVKNINQLVLKINNIKNICGFSIATKGLNKKINYKIFFKYINLERLKNNPVPIGYKELKNIITSKI